MRAHTKPRQRGLTMIEVMVATALGLVLTTTVLAMYVASSRNYSQDERYALMQENGRYALRILGEDLMMADFWGKVMSTDTVTTTVTAPSGDCTVDIAAYDATTSLLFNNNHASPPSTQFTPCAAVTNNLVAGTDVVAVKRVEGAPTAQTFIDTADTDGDGDTAETITTGASELDNGTVYLRTNGTVGIFIDDAEPSNPPLLGESDWRYAPRLYFIRDFHETAGDGIPSLCRLTLLNDGFGPAECVAEGVEDLHLEFGLDSDADGTPNRYTASPTAADMINVVSVRIFVLMRSSNADAHYTNAKTYRLGDVVKPAANDGFYRRVYTSTVLVRNAVGRRQFL